MSHIQRFAVRIQRSFADTLRQRWMSVDRLNNLLARRLKGSRNDKFTDHLCSFRADNVRSEELTVFRIKNQFDESFRFVDCERFAVRAKRISADLQLITFFARLLFSQADAGNLRLAVRATRNVVIVNRMRVLTGNFLNTGTAFSRCDMGQPWRTVDVADSVYAVDICFVEFVDLDERAVGLHAESFESEIFNVSLDADCHESNISLQIFLAIFV